jgi:hypothetical protein
VKRLLALAAALAQAVDINDVVTFGGLGLACYGIAQIHEPAAYITGGCALFWLGIRRG